ncbi:hypothetical protein [Chitinimonas naiadis]
MKKLLLLAVLAHAASALAADKVLLEAPVTYHANASVVDSVKTECKIEEMLTRDVGAALVKVNKGGNGTVASAAEAGDAAVLRLQISHVLGVGGGAWSGPKAITVYAELVENGKVTRSGRVNRWSTGGMWGGFKGTCSILDRCSKALGADLSKWVVDPSFKLEEIPAPTEKIAEAKPE